MQGPVIPTVDENGLPIRTGKDVAKDPRVGDELHRGSKYRKVIAIRRVGQYGMEIDYIDKYGKECTSWITTWYNWCRYAKTPAQMAVEKAAMKVWRESYEGRHAK